MATRESVRVAKDKAVSFDSSSLVTIVVGKEPNQQRFSVHDSIIEKEERVVKFPEDDADIFSVYLNIVYTNLLHTNPNLSEQPKAVDEIRSEYLVLGKLYVLCEKLQDRAAKNSVARAILAVSKEKCAKGGTQAPHREVVDIVYQGTCTDSKGRLLMADSWTGVTSDEYIVSSATFLPKDFYVDLIVALRLSVASRADASRYIEKNE